MSVRKETISRITDKVLEEMQSWQQRPQPDPVYTASPSSSAATTANHSSAPPQH